MKLAGMQRWRAKNKPLSIQAALLYLNIPQMPQIHVKYLLLIKITNLATEGALSLIFLFITNCHKLTYSCLLEFLISKEKREGNVIFSAFVSLKDPFPPENSLSQRSRLLRIQH